MLACSNGDADLCEQLLSLIPLFTPVDGDGPVGRGRRDEVELRELHVRGDVDPAPRGPLVGDLLVRVTDCDGDMEVAFVNRETMIVH